MAPTRKPAREEGATKGKTTMQEKKRISESEKRDRARAAAKRQTKLMGGGSVNTAPPRITIRGTNKRTPSLSLTKDVTGYVPRTTGASVSASSPTSGRTATVRTGMPAVQRSANSGRERQVARGDLMRGASVNNIDTSGNVRKIDQRPRQTINPGYAVLGTNTRPAVANRGISLTGVKYRPLQNTGLTQDEMTRRFLSSAGPFMDAAYTRAQQSQKALGRKTKTARNAKVQRAKKRTSRRGAV